MTTSNAMRSISGVAPATPAANDLRIAAARLRYEAARDAENAASWLLPDELPRVQVGTGLAGQPRYAYTEDEIEASPLACFRSMPAGHIRNRIELTYWHALAEYRLKRAEYDNACEACGHGAAYRELTAAGAALDLLTL